MKKNDFNQSDGLEGEAEETRTGLDQTGVTEISTGLRILLADVFALYVKTKNFHWHLSGAHFRDYHLLFDEQAEQIFAISDEVAERARKIGGFTLRSISDISRHQAIKDNNAEFVPAKDMIAELGGDNCELVQSLRRTHEVCERYNDVATTSLIENWINEAERRVWFLSEIEGGL